MEKVSMNKLEMARRAAKGGSGGVTPADIERLEGEISILGSQNETQAQDITDIKAQLTNLVAPYATTKHKTGRKWTDGKDIFEITYHYESGIALTNPGADSGIPHTNFDKIISCCGIGNNCQCVSGNTFYSSDNIRISVHEPLTVYDIVFEYTEPTV